MVKTPILETRKLESTKIRILNCQSIIDDGCKEMIGKIFNPIFILHNSIVVEYDGDNIRLNTGEYEFVKDIAVITKDSDDTIKSIEQEIWKDIEGYEGLYQISNEARVKRLAKYTENLKYLPEKIMKPMILESGNVTIRLVNNKKGTTYTLNRLMYKTFNPDFNEKDLNILILNKDGNKQNNKLENLYECKKNNLPRILEPKKPVICVSTGKYFDSIREASEYYKIFASDITKCCKRKAKFTGRIVLDDGAEYKLIWRYLEEEIWKDVETYEGLYQVSNFGRFKSLDKNIGKRCFKGKLITPQLRNGYAYVRFNKDGERISASLSRVIYKTFNPNFDDKNLNLEIRHKDNNSRNNEPTNLYVETKNIRKGHEVKFFCTTTKILFNNLKEAMEYGNLKSGASIVFCCQRKRKFSGKLEDGTRLKWRYYHEYLKLKKGKNKK